MAKCSCCSSGGLFKKLYGGMCVSCLESAYKKQETEISNLKALLTPEMRDLKLIQDSIASAKDALTVQENELRELKNKVLEITSELFSVSEIAEYETFSLYEPKYEFEKSEQYKAKLDEIRDTQKQMIKGKIAALCSKEWTVDGNRSKGIKMTDDNIKLLLRSFNNECDLAVSSVRFSNFERCEKRINKSFSVLNKIGESNAIQISKVYLQLKIEELHLAFEYQTKKQQEKEALRELREQQREEARLAKEIEEARKQAEKEKKHFTQALEKLTEQLSRCSSEQERADILARQTELSAHLEEITTKLADIDYRQSNQRAGYVYVISNIGSFGEGIYKIGMTRRLEPQDRVDELGDASVPFRFDVHAMVFSDDAPKLEAALHRAFEKNRINMINNRREYFRADLEDIKQVIRDNHDKTVEFTDIPEAEQYRESLKMANKLLNPKTPS